MVLALITYGETVAIWIKGVMNAIIELGIVLGLMHLAVTNYQMHGEY